LLCLSFLSMIIHLHEMCTVHAQFGAKVRAGEQQPFPERFGWGYRWEVIGMPPNRWETMLLLLQGVENKLILGERGATGYLLFEEGEIVAAKAW
ncbi:MAG: hypothetical protein IT282_13170, partial [Bacteroidetes bacterium]|nr:hypothetical protein [Bacteroidota bacterium]